MGGVGHIVVRPLAFGLCLLPTIAPASADTDPLTIFSENCLNPFLTADAARADVAGSDARLDFYDLAPLAHVPRTLPVGTATPGTDRRCEIAFDGDHGEAAADEAIAALEAEGILVEAPLPATHADAMLPGTTLLAARSLNPARVAVVHTGTRPGPNGLETFLSVERLTPEASR